MKIDDQETIAPPQLGELAVTDDSDVAVTVAYDVMADPLYKLLAGVSPGLPAMLPRFLFVPLFHLGGIPVTPLLLLTVLAVYKLMKSE